LCRHHGDLFLAGDPAQSVVEGSDFRFEDIRTVAHFLFQNEKTGKKGIPEKPMKLNVNFRSHSGILNVASGVLDLLFSAFPGSAKELPRDKGLFVVRDQVCS
jgi:superfamily I DNA/RNA helicase